MKYVLYFSFQFDLLRKRSFVERRKRSLLERIHKADEVFQQRLGDLVAEPLETETSRFEDLDYEVVDHEGMLCMLESLVQMDSHDSVPFIKVSNWSLLCRIYSTIT